MKATKQKQKQPKAAARKKAAPKAKEPPKPKMTRKETGRFGVLGGAPRKEIDFNVFEGLCRHQCTEVEIAAIFDIDTDTLNARIKEHYGEGFSDTYKKKSSGGKVSLRRLQLKSAEAGNVTMQIWLGKQWLGQTDKQEVTEKIDWDGLTDEQLERIAGGEPPAAVLTTRRAKVA